MADNPLIFVVDDEEKISALLKRLLEREGHDVATFSDGRDALELMPARRPQLLITDLKMPGIDGLELLRRARRIDPDLPVVLITGYASMETAVEALREGVDDYITKPFSIEELKGVVGRIIENRCLKAENARLVEELKEKNDELRVQRARLRVDVDEANEELARRVRELEAIRGIDRMTCTIFDEQELITLAARLIKDMVEVDAVALALVEGRSLEVKAYRGDEGALEPGHLLPTAEGVIAHCVREGATLHLPALSTERRATEDEQRAFGAGPFLAVPLLAKERVSGALAVSRAAEGARIGQDEARLLALIANDLSIAIENARLFRENEETYLGVLFALVESMEARDPFLRRHSERVRMKSLRMAKALRLTSREIDALDTGARLHDLGKIGIPDRALHKPEALTPDEWEMMRSHPVIGDRIVQPLSRLDIVKGIIRHHHERWDGAGYPDGLAGEQIPLLAQVVTVADAYDAMTSRRPYREPLPQAEALAELTAGAGTQFNPHMVEVFLELERGREPAAAVTGT